MCVCGWVDAMAFSQRVRAVDNEMGMWASRESCASATPARATSWGLRDPRRLVGMKYSRFPLQGLGHGLKNRVGTLPASFPGAAVARLALGPPCSTTGPIPAPKSRRHLVSPSFKQPRSSGHDPCARWCVQETLGLAAAWLGGSGCSPMPSRHVPSSKPLVEMAVSSGFSRALRGPEWS